MRNFVAEKRSNNDEQSNLITGPGPSDRFCKETRAVMPSRVRLRLDIIDCLKAAVCLALLPALAIGFLAGLQGGVQTVDVGVIIDY